MKWTASPKLGADAVDFSALEERIAKIEPDAIALEKRVAKIEAVGISYTEKKKYGNSGYCTPFGTTGDLCADNAKQELQTTCQSSTDSYLDKSCKKDCAEARCNADSLCKGFTERKLDRHCTQDCVY